MKHIHTFAALFFAIALSAWLARVERHSDDEFILIGMIGVGAFLVAMVEPRRPWMWGLIVPAGIILVNAWNMKAGNEGTVAAIAGLTIAVSSAGAYTGAFVRRRAASA